MGPADYLNFKGLVSQKFNIRELLLFTQVLHMVVDKCTKNIVPMSVTQGGGQEDQINSFPELVFFKTGAHGYKKLKCIKLQVPGEHKLYIANTQFFKVDIQFYTYEICTFIKYGDEILQRKDRSLIPYLHGGLIPYLGNFWIVGSRAGQLEIGPQLFHGLEVAAKVT